MSLSAKKKIEILLGNPKAKCAVMRTSRGGYVFAVAGTEADAQEAADAMNERFGKTNPSKVVDADEALEELTA